MLRPLAAAATSDLYSIEIEANALTSSPVPVNTASPERVAVLLLSVLTKPMSRPTTLCPVLSLINLFVL